MSVAGTRAAFSHHRNVLDTFGNDSGTQPSHARGGTMDRRVAFDFDIEFTNGGGLQGQDFRLDVPGERRHRRVDRGYARA